MQNRIVKLPGVRACALNDLLQALIDEIGRRRAPHRPLVYSLTARKATGPFVHPGVDLHNGQLYLMYAYPPSPARTLGHVILAIAACTAAGCGPACCNKCEGELGISVWRDPTFPFTLEEVHCFIADYFQLSDLAWANIEDDCWRSLRDFFRAVSAVPSLEPGVEPGAGPGAVSGTGAAPARGKPGAPWLDCNLWLRDKLEQLPDLTANTHLESEYLRRHFDETGIDLAVPHRDFQKAAARCVKVIRARRRKGSC